MTPRAGASPPWIALCWVKCTERCAATQIQATLQGCQIEREIWQPCIQSQTKCFVGAAMCRLIYIYIKATQIYIFFSFFIYIYINIYIFLNFVPTTLGANHQNVQTNCDRNNGGRRTVQRRGFLSVQRALSPLSVRGTFSASRAACSHRGRQYADSPI